MKNLLTEFAEFTLKSNLKTNLLSFIYAFMAGLVIFSIPSMSNFIRNFRNERLIKAERKIQLSRQEAECKNLNSDYNKFSNLGFSKTAIERFNNCMKSK